MRKIKRIWFLLISILCFAVLLGPDLWEEYLLNRVPVRYHGKIMGIPIVKDVEFLDGMEQLSAEENPGVCFEEVLMPYSKSTGTLYMSQDYASPAWEGTVSEMQKGVFLCTPEDSYWEDKASAIRESHTFPIYMVTEEGYYEFELVVSGMPVICIDTEYSEEPEEVRYEDDPDKVLFDSEILYYGDFRLYNPKAENDTYQIIESRVKYHDKGASSTELDKTSYSISLQNSAGENENIALLGMREENSWKLNALTVDSNRIREKTAAQIWEQFALAETTVNEAGPREEYVELILDNDYLGLYCLVEPVDKKKLELTENNYMYKIVDWTVPTDEAFEETIEWGWKFFYPARIRHPEVIDDIEAAWYPFRDYVATFQREDNVEGAEEKIYPENVVDMYLFLMTVTAADNHYKNLYYVADVADDGTYKMRQIPWDLDVSFGNIFDYFSVNFTTFNPDYTVVYQESAMPVLLAYSPDTVKELLQEKWLTYRETFLSTEYIQNLLTENMDYLIETGVVARENARWPQYFMDTDIDYLLEYQDNRMKWLDDYIGSIVAE